MQIHSPTQYQTFQSDQHDRANIPIAASFAFDGAVFARFNSGDWQAIGASQTGSFEGTLPDQITGQGDLSVMVQNGTQVDVETVPFVGVGDVIVIKQQRLSHDLLDL